MADPPPPSVLPLPILSALQAAGIDADAISIRVSDAAGGVRLDWRGDAVREVGSVIKLFTTLAALDLLGPDFRFHTELLAEPGAGGRWQLGVRAGGDPGLRYEDLHHLLRAAHAAGVRHPLPQVRIDSRRFAGDDEATSGIRLDADRVSATPPWPLMVEQAAVQVTLPAGHAGAPLLDPPFRLVERTRAAAACPPDWEDGLHLSPVPAGGGRDAGLPGLALTGVWPAACPQASLLRAPLAPAAYLDLALATAGQAAGLGSRLRGEPGDLPGAAQVLLRQESRPLAELVRDINKYSNNLMARMLFLDLAAEQGELPASPRAAARVVQRWLAQAGLAAPELELENGAGLSHRERITAGHLDELLKYALTLPVWPEFLASLPIAGHDGTLRTQFRELDGAARLRLKTGAIDGVRSLAGYLLAEAGRPATLVCIVNTPNTERVRLVQAAVLAWALRDQDATAAARRGRADALKVDLPGGLE